MHVYNQAAGQLPKVKLATLEEIQRRTSASDFDPRTRFYAIKDDTPVAYATFQDNGRVSYPWCLPGHEDCQGPLMEQVYSAMSERGIAKATIAYRGDWEPVLKYFEDCGFVRTCEMLNFGLDVRELPTAFRGDLQITPLKNEDVPEILEMAKGVSSVPPDVIEQSWLANPWFNRDSFFVLRRKPLDKISGVGILVTGSNYANVTKLDADMPCFRLGAFGTEGLTWKRINGLFSFLARDPDNATPVALDLLGHAHARVDEAEVEMIAAQVPSTAEHLVQFYQNYFEMQGGFPIYEKSLSG